jgi:hypothetical protein
VLTGIPRCFPNSRSVNRLRRQCANTRRICRARIDVVDPILPIDSFLRTHSARRRIAGGDVLGHTVTYLVYCDEAGISADATKPEVLEFCAGLHSHLDTLDPLTRAEAEVRANSEKEINK